VFLVLVRFLRPQRRRPFSSKRASSLTSYQTWMMRDLLPLYLRHFTCLIVLIGPLHSHIRGLDALVQEANAAGVDFNAGP